MRDQKGSEQKCWVMFDGSLVQVAWNVCLALACLTMSSQGFLQTGQQAKVCLSCSKRFFLKLLQCLSLFPLRCLQKATVRYGERTHAHAHGCAEVLGDKQM